MFEYAVTILAIAAMLFNFINVLKQRKVLKRSYGATIEDVPPELIDDVKQQIKDGYILLSVLNGKVRLIKTQRYWLPFFLFPLLPNAINTILTSSFFCNIYGVELSIGDCGVELSTY